MKSDQLNHRISFGDSSSIDAFGQMRVSNPTSVFDSQLQYDSVGLLYYTKTAGAGTTTHLPNESAVNLTVSNASGDVVIRQTKEYVRYQPGRSQRVEMTGTFAGWKANLVQRMGYFDDDNGTFFELDNQTLYVVLRSKTTGSVVDTRVAQSSWNVDKFDGTGPSGINLDKTKSQIFFMDLEWLSVGRVRYGFVVDGKIYYCHYINNANSVTGAYMTTANLPIRYEIRNTGATSGSSSLKQICASVKSEGGFTDERGFPFCASNGITSISVTTRRPILSIRSKATFNSIVNRGQIIARSFDIVSATNNIFFELVYGGTLTNANFTSVDANSITERDVSATAISGGQSIICGYVLAAGSGSNARGSATGSLISKLPLSLDIDGLNPTNLTLVATSFTGTATVNAGINWVELR